METPTKSTSESSHSSTHLPTLIFPSPSTIFSMLSSNSPPQSQPQRSSMLSPPITPNPYLTHHFYPNSFFASHPSVVANSLNSSISVPSSLLTPASSSIEEDDEEESELIIDEDPHETTVMPACDCNSAPTDHFRPLDTFLADYSQLTLSQLMTAFLGDFPSASVPLASSAPLIDETLQQQQQLLKAREMETADFLAQLQMSRQMNVLDTAAAAHHQPAQQHVNSQPIYWHNNAMTPTVVPTGNPSSLYPSYRYHPHSSFPPAI